MAANVPPTQTALAAAVPPTANADGLPIVHPGKTVPKLPWPDIGHTGRWTVSSYKFGFGPECLTDGDPETFWHSDGGQPHFIMIEFNGRTTIQKVSVHLSFPFDDSYTPSTIAVRAGTGPSDLQDIRAITLDKPDGWITFDVTTEPNEDGDGFKPVGAYVLQVIVLANHMNGKDTHIRGLRILAPAEEEGDDGDPFKFKSQCYTLYQTLR
ncbi:anaphase-promoting complex subunit 10 [Heliocybe sulcata]|uniref:Anaphase-promoting complex subunit 10 n=1 Tax=Heliocybe sulcata TaxID=5364 RepID=A0A5C3MS90_9AGAM|nr:anaphase-promoting complex subunit 10 [Heliocybe sulcata]